jgi:ABC-type lipoprotein release transport system permease subunit
LAVARCVSIWYAALDAGLLALVPITLLVVTGIACLLPALRAAHADPLDTLRHE